MSKPNTNVCRGTPSPLNGERAGVRGESALRVPNSPRLRPAHVVLYDDSCPLCTFQMRVITWLDWFNVVRLLPLSHPGASELAPMLTQEALLEAIHCLAKDGRIHRGARCIRFIGLRMPLAVPVALVLWLPGVIWVAEGVYQWTSRKRHLLSRMFGCKEACALLPARKRPSGDR